MTGQQAHRSATFVFSLVMVVIGVALIAQAVDGHGGVISPRLLLGPAVHRGRRRAAVPGDEAGQAGS